MFFGFENITIAYGRKPVLENVTVDVPKGKVLTLIGKNGCGKSSLLKTVFRAVAPRTGRVVLENRPVQAYKARELSQRIAYLPQMHASPPDIDVRTLVSYGRYPHTRFGKRLSLQDEQIVTETLAFTRLSDLSGRALSTLSGGERQRAWLAMAICQKPDILILDEPTTYLDISYQVEVLDLIQRLNRAYKTTILMVLHDLNLASRYSDVLLAIKDGRVLTSGRPQDIITRDNLLSVFEVEADVFEDKTANSPFFIPRKTIFHEEE